MEDIPIEKVDDTPLGHCHLVDIKGYLNTLGRPTVTDLGLVLGVLFPTMRNLPDDDFLNQVITLWLDKADNVESEPSWRSLVHGLRHKQLRQNGIANSIAKDHCITDVQSQAECPKIITHPEKLKDTVPGKPVSFTVKATGTEPLRYQWQWKPVVEGVSSKEWQNLTSCGSVQGADTATLTYSKIADCSEGLYRCVVTNPVGEEISECTDYIIGKITAFHDLLNDLSTVTQWYLLGIYLQLHPSTLDVVRNEHITTAECRTQMLIEWRKRVIPTWSAVVKALMGIGRERLASDLAAKYGIPLPDNVDDKPLEKLEIAETKQKTVAGSEADSTKVCYDRHEFQRLGGRLSEIDQLLKTSRDSQVPLKENANTIVSELNKLGKEMQKLAQEKENTESELKRKQHDIQLLREIQKDSVNSVEKCQLLQKTTNDKETEIKKLEEELKQNEYKLESVQQDAQVTKENMIKLQAQLEEKHENVIKFQKEKEELTKSYITEKEKAKQLVQIALSDRNEMEQQLIVTKEELEHKSQQIAACNSLINNLTEEVETLSSSLQEKEAAVAQLESELHSYQKAASNLKQLSDIIALTTEIADLKQKLQEGEVQKHQAILEREAAVQEVEAKKKVEMQLHRCLDEPPKVTGHPKNMKDAVPGKPVTFKVQATGMKPLNYQWQHKTGDESGGWQLCDVGRFPGANSSTLTIPSVQKSDEGSFHCTVSNCAGSETSEYATLIIADPPRITTHPKDSKDAVSGISVNFTVQATGTEPLNYNWEWNPVKEEGIGKWLLCSGMEGSDTATLTISSVQKSNEGSYRCVISNCAGNQTCKAAKLEVEYQEIMSDEEAQTIVDQALKSGSLEQRNTVAVVVGVVGSGKTWLISRLFRVNPPGTYTSTGIAEQAFRGLMHHIATMDSWKPLSPEKVLEILAPFIQAGLPEADITSLAQKFTEEKAPEPIQTLSLTQPTPETPPSPSPSHSHATVHTPAALSLASPSHSHATIHTSTSPSPYSSATVHTHPSPSFSYSPPKERSASETMIRLVQTLKGSKNVPIIELLHMIDTGGQPEFMEIMPSLIHNSNITVLVMNLAQSLDEYPHFAFYEDGTPFKRPLPSVLTNRQLINQFVCTMQAKQPTHTSSQNSKVTVIGTHRDCVKGKLSETLAAINKELRSIFLPAMKDELIVYCSYDEIIFPVNLLNPNDNDEEVLKVIRECISNTDIGEAKIPVSFFMFEQDAIKYAKQQMGKDRKVLVLSFKECMQVGARLKMSRDIVKAALIYFHRHNVFLYFQRILPNVVFLAPQVPLDFVNEIVAFSYKVKSGAIHGLDGKYVCFCNEGIITEEMLCYDKNLQLSDHFIHGIYEPQDAINLFLHIYAIAPLKKEVSLAKNTHSSRPRQKALKLEYLMMSLLDDKPENEIQEYLPSSSKVAPLVIHFSSGCVPNGCFGNTTACLISTYNWEVCRTEKDLPECLTHNVVTLSDPTLPVTITMVNYVRHLEVHINMAEVKEEDFNNICLKVYKTVFATIETVFKVMRFEDIEVKEAFLCPCKCRPKSHAATVCHLPSSSYIICSKTKKQVRSLRKEEQVWFQGGKKAEPPQIITHPQEVVDAVLGECVMFGIEAIGTEPLSYQWKHKTEGSGGWQMCDLVGVKSSKLTVLNVQKSNEGSYHCTVNNHVGSETSECATLTVAEPPRITTQPNDLVHAIPGNPVMFTVQATGTKPLNYHWQWNPAKEGESEEWQPCSGVKGSDTTTLTIPSVQKSNKGSYRCVISNCAGSQTSKPAKLETHLLSELTWRRLPDMPRAMVDPQSITVDTVVYIAERYARGDILRYDPHTNELTQLPQYQYCGFTLTELTHQLVMVGGYDVSIDKKSKTVQVYDHTQRSWKQPYPPMNTPRYWPAVSTYHQRLVVAGGYDGGNLATVEILDTSVRHCQWFSAMPLPVSCRRMSAAITHGTLYLLGGTLGKQVLSVSLSALTQTDKPPAQWRTLPDTPLKDSTAITVHGSLLAVGGSHGGQRSSAIHVYDQEKNAWNKVGDLPTERQDCACCLLPSGEILVAGGDVGNYNWTSRMDAAAVKD